MGDDDTQILRPGSWHEPQSKDELEETSEVQPSREPELELLLQECRRTADAMGVSEDRSDALLKAPAAQILRRHGERRRDPWAGHTRGTRDFGRKVEALLADLMAGDVAGAAISWRRRDGRRRGDHYMPQFDEELGESEE